MIRWCILQQCFDEHWVDSRGANVWIIFLFVFQKPERKGMTEIVSIIRQARHICWTTPGDELYPRLVKLVLGTEGIVHSTRPTSFGPFKLGLLTLPPRPNSHLGGFMTSHKINDSNGTPRRCSPSFRSFILPFIFLFCFFSPLVLLLESPRLNKEWEREGWGGYFVIFRIKADLRRLGSLGMEFHFIP